MKCRRLSKRARRLTVVWLQIILIVLHILIFGIGLAIFGWGYSVEYSSYGSTGVSFELSHLLLTTPSTLLIGYGILLAILGFIGLLGNCCSSGWLIRWSALLAISIFLGDSLIGIQSFTGSNYLAALMNKIATSMNDYNLKGARPVGIWQLTPKDYWEVLQEKGKCCGLNSYRDWFQTRIGKNDDLPSSCCKDTSPTCGEGILTESWAGISKNGSISYLDLINQRGCWEDQELIMKYYKEIRISGSIIGSTLLLSIFMTLLLFIAFLLNKRHKHKHRRLYTFRELMRCGKNSKIGLMGGLDDLSAYRESAMKFQVQKRDEYFDRTGGIPKHDADFHPKHAADQVKKWVAKDPSDENRQSTPPPKATRVWPLNLSEEEIKRNLLVHLPHDIPFEDFYTNHLVDDSKKVRRH